jgi:hypothetical protein
MSIETLDSSVESTSLGGHLVSNFTKNNPTKQLGKTFQLNAYS